MMKALPHELLIATTNKGKTSELRSLLSSLSLPLRSLAEFPEVADVAETGATFAENAILKARGYAKQTQLWTLADDSGLEVDALGGAPGVYSARYGGEGLTDADRVQRLLEALSQSGNADRHARFVCVIAIADPPGKIVNLSTGICEGTIAYAPRGANGFGYDPVFVPEGYEQSFGELTTAIKERISHRARALSGAHSFLRSVS
ncbi:MAG TPA: RdgB/HAM1 family non-canonical purine NTP pyrophosphatase [Pyrinomonadaceae bacterium]|jgi:XTP/dITP diphosphohydrolase|nr:RdgB/HAM1 family non-canonical purine NTP pyrophosphatase [Pyrinomonadaceae bacterium]